MNTLDKYEKVKLESLKKALEFDHDDILIECLRKKNWNIDSAADYFYENDMESRISTIFSNYTQTDKMNGDQLDTFLTEIEAPFESQISRLILFHLQAKGLSCTRKKFNDGLKTLKMKTVQDFKNNKQSLQKMFETEFKKVYEYTFEILAFDEKTNQTKVSLTYDVAQDEFEIFFKDKYPTILSKFLTFLTSKRAEIRKDEWSMFYIFLQETNNDIKNYDFGKHWPMLIDEFAKTYDSIQ